MRKRAGLATAVAAALVAVFGVASPASAATVRVVDGDDSDAAADLLKVRVSHGAKQVRVRTVHDDLVRRALVAQQGLTVYLDTDPDDAGPEYRLVAGLNRGTDYSLQRVDRWNGGGRTLRCSHRLSIDWKKDVAVVRFGRGCLGRPDQVRVAVRVGEVGHEGQQYVDWLRGPRKYTAWVAQG